MTRPHQEITDKASVMVVWYADNHLDWFTTCWNHNLKGFMTQEYLFYLSSSEGSSIIIIINVLMFVPEESLTGLSYVVITELKGRNC